MVKVSGKPEIIMELKTTIDYARWYVSKGFSVIPLKPKSKIPDERVLPIKKDNFGTPILNDRGEPERTWTPYQESFPTEDELLSWFGNNSKRNIGIITGKISGIAILDCDSYQAWERCRAMGLLQKAPAVITSISRSGKINKDFPKRHFYCRHTEGVGNKINIDGVNLDLKGDGGYCVAPPSFHPSGSQYTWENIHLLDTLPELPKRILKEFSVNKPKVRNLYAGVPEGQRNDSLARLVGSWVNDGLSFEECLEFAYQWNERNDPPETDSKKIERTVKSIYEKHHREKELNPDKDKEAEKHIDTSQFKPITLDDLKSILGLTIKRDDDNKLITFCAMLSAYTEDSQLNVSFNAPSSTGKSYIPSEIAQLFPQEDVIQVGYCSPTAFFHDIGNFDKDKGGFTVNLERKIIIFLDQPHSLLLQHLRPVLSHDKKEIQLKITDKTKRAGLRTRNIFIIGFPAVVFCTAWLKIDEQEATRFFLLSPDTRKEKVQAGIKEKIRKESDKRKYLSFLENHPERQLLKERIRAIKAENISDIRIPNIQKVEDMFFEKVKVLKSRHQRDIGYILSLIKVMALLNLWFRDRDSSTIIANDKDIEDAFQIWGKISKSQEYGLPPYIYDIYHEVILAQWKETQIPLSRKDIIQRHYKVHGRLLADWLLRKEIIPALENVGLIMQEPDKDDRRKMLIIPTANEDIHPIQSVNSADEDIVESRGCTSHQNEDRNSGVSGVYPESDEDKKQPSEGRTPYPVHYSSPTSEGNFEYCSEGPRDCGKRYMMKFHQPTGELQAWCVSKSQWCWRD